MSEAGETESSLLAQAHEVLPGGSFGNTAADLIITRGQGCRVWDDAGNEYIDYLIGSGPMLLGHNHPEVTAAARSQLEQGTTFFANNPHGIALAQMIVDAVPCADKVRFASTGSEADAYAMRLARAYTGRDKILKFEGGYHGYSDWGLMSLAPATPGNSAVPIRDSAGIPESLQENVIVAPFNDADAVEGLIREYRNEIAAVFMEPLQRLIPPQPGFLEAMRRLTREHDMLLVFDEVVTGFRLAYGGAQEHYGVIPDLCTLGKAIGGGFPLSAVAGRDDIMALFDRSRTATDRFVPMVGTLSGNPIAAAAGIATLEVLKRPGSYARLFEVGEQLMSGLTASLERAGIEAEVVGAPPMFDVVFAAGAVRNYRDTLRGDPQRLARYNALLRERGILKGDTKYYISLAIEEADIAKTLSAWDEALPILAAG